MAWGAKQHVEKILDKYERTYGSKPKMYTSAMEENCNPELDTSELLEADEIVQYQSAIRELQWAVTLGCFDILAATTTLSRFRIAPRTGQMDRINRVYGYLKKFSHGAIRFRTEIPQHEQRFKVDAYDWMQTIYGKGKEDFPPNMPTPKGKPVRTTSHVDANLLHCKLTGRSLTGILHFLNQTPSAWFSKRQATVETATYG